jgi:hypothetical protein
VTDPRGFARRGLKGLWWEPEQYLSWPAFLADAGYDLLMLCYTFCPETGLSWRQPLRDAEVQIVGRLAEACTTRGITLCLALHPLIAGQAWAPEDAAVRFHPTTGRSWFLRHWEARRPGETLRPDPPIEYGSEVELALLAEKCRQARALGVGAIALCLDDVDLGTTPPGFPSLAAAHLWLVNGLRAAMTSSPGPLFHDARGPSASTNRSLCSGQAGAPRLRRLPVSRDPRVGTERGRSLRLFVVPTYYWTEGARANAAYTAELARGLPSDVDVFWTGAVVRDHAITAETAREAASLFGRRPIVWLNYASNDSFRFAIQLPPDRLPATDLAPETAGLLLNSTRQTGLARLDALIVGAYLADPAGYDHERAVHRAIVDLLGESAAPPYERLMDAWRAVPDVRTLTHDLQAGGRAFLDTLLGRLRPALATLDVVMPELGACLADRVLWVELAAAVERLRLLVDALAVLESELITSGSDTLGPATDAAPSPPRSALLTRLAVAHPEAACDAEAVLTLSPVRTPRHDHTMA